MYPKIFKWKVAGWIIKFELEDFAFGIIGRMRKQRESIYIKYIFMYVYFDEPFELVRK